MKELSETLPPNALKNYSEKKHTPENFYPMMINLNLYLDLYLYAFNMNSNHSHLLFYLYSKKYSNYSHNALIKHSLINYSTTLMKSKYNFGPNPRLKIYLRTLSYLALFPLIGKKKKSI